MTETGKPLLSLEDIGWTPALEHQVETQIKVHEELMRFCGELARSAPERLPSVIDEAVKRVMDVAYQTPEHLTGGVPELWGPGEMADFFGVTPNRARKIPDTAPGFPAPAVRLKGQKIWLADDVRKFAQTWNRRPGPNPLKEKET